jgi:hypothetical protein
VKAEEIGAAVFGFALACAMFLVIALAGGVLSGSTFFNSGANVIQWTSGPALIAGLSMAAWSHWHNRCAYGLCIRHGEHPVDGTVKKVCRHHHLANHHRAVYAMHAVEHAWGYSHLKQAAKPATSRGRARGL